MRGTQTAPRAERNRKISGVLVILLLQLALIHYFFLSSKPYPPLKKEKMFDVYFAFHMKLRKLHFFWKGVARAYVATL